MRIAVVEPIGVGGMIHYAWQLCSAMRRAGADVTLITDASYELDRLPHPFELDKRLRLWDAKRSDGQPSRSTRLARRAGRAAVYYREWMRLVAHLRRLRPDVAQFGDIRFATDLLPLRALRGSGVHLADICHNVAPFATGGGTFSHSVMQKRMYGRIYREFDSIFVHFETSRGAFASTYGLSDRLTTIVHGNEAIFDLLRDAAVKGEHLRRSFSIPSNAQVILLFGTLSPYKRIDLLIDAFARLRATRPDAHLVLAGFPVGLDPEDVRRSAHAAGIADAFTLVSHYLESGAVAAWMELASVVVFPYDAVFQSGAVHVPLTFGRPVVATAVGAMPLVVEHERTGLLVPPADTEALASALHRLLGDPALAQHLGATAAEEQRTRFSWDTIAQRMLERYEHASGGRR